MTKLVYAAVAAALLVPVPALATDLGPPGYYRHRAYHGYPAPVIHRRIIHKEVFVERPLVIHRRPIVVERPVIVERPIIVERPVVIEKRVVVVERPVIVKRRHVFVDRNVGYGFGRPDYGPDFDDDYGDYDYPGDGGY